MLAWDFCGRWHERWIGYRLLAELCRKQQALTTIGWTLPALQVNRIARAGSADVNWLNWYFDAAVCAAPLGRGLLSGDQLAAARNEIRATLVAGQMDYHRQRAAESTLAAARLAYLGEICFALTLLTVTAKVVMLFTSNPSVTVALLSLASAILPALAAGFFAIRAYAELEVLADQSERMLLLLDSLEHRLHSLKLDVPLASETLGRDLFQLTTAMLADVGGWAQLFRMKVVEAG
jgi:hypothetical protein